MFASPFQEQENRFRRNKVVSALGLTLLLHGAIILIFFLVKLTTPIPPFPELAGEGMAVNFGFDESGTGETQAFSYNTGPMDASTETPAVAAGASAEENALTQESEEEVALPENKTKVKPTPAPTPPVKTETKPPTTANTSKPAVTTNAPAQPQSNPDALFTKGAFGKPNNSKGDGTGGGQGDQGRPDGDPNSRNYLGDGGTGNSPGGGGAGGSGFSLRGRNKVALPAPAQCNSKGKVVIGIKVAKTGRVVEAKFRRFDSTVFDDCNVNNALEAARKATFNADPDAPDIQEGTITYIYKVN